MSDKRNDPASGIDEFNDADIGSLFESHIANAQTKVSVPASVDEAIFAAAHDSQVPATSASAQLHEFPSDANRHHHSENTNLSRVWPQFFAAAAVLVLAVTVVPLVTRQSENTRTEDMAAAGSLPAVVATDKQEATDTSVAGKVAAAASKLAAADRDDEDKEFADTDAAARPEETLPEETAPEEVGPDEVGPDEVVRVEVESANADVVVASRKKSTDDSQFSRADLQESSTAAQLAPLEEKTVLRTQTIGAVPDSLESGGGASVSLKLELEDRPAYRAYDESASEDSASEESTPSKRASSEQVREAYRVAQESIAARQTNADEAPLSEVPSAPVAVIEAVPSAEVELPVDEQNLTVLSGDAATEAKLNRLRERLAADSVPQVSADTAPDASTGTPSANNLSDSDSAAATVGPVALYKQAI